MSFMSSGAGAQHRNWNLSLGNTGGDPYWSSVALLLKATPTVLADSSRYNRTPSVNAAVLQDTVTTKFDSASIWCNTNASAQWNNDSTIQLPAVWSVEMWMNLGSNNNWFSPFMNNVASAGAANCIKFRNKPAVQGNGIEVQIQSNAYAMVAEPMTPGVWTWVQFLCDGDRVRCGYNGVVSTAYPNGVATGGVAFVGSSFVGFGRITSEASTMLDTYIDDYRVTLGVNRGFYLPTGPLPVG